MKRIIFIFTLFFFLSGCKKDVDSPVKPDQAIYFQIEGINYAWGIYHAGILIDSLGNVRRFNLPRKWTFPDSLGNIKGVNMMENFAQTDTTIAIIQRDSLYQYIEKIYYASKGNVTDPVMKMVDAGVTRYSAYLYDKKSDRYKEVLLKQTGDQFIDNLSPEASQIYNWLTRIKFR